MVACFVAHAGEGNVPPPAQGHVGVYLVGDNGNAPFGTQPGQPHERIARPQATSGVVRIAQDEQAGAAGQLAFQVVEVPQTDQPAPPAETPAQPAPPAGAVVPDAASAPAQPGARTAGDPLAAIVGKHADYYLAEFKKIDAGQKTHPLLVRHPAVAFVYPTGCHLEVVSGQDSVAQDGVLHTSADGIEHAVRRAEIHVRHPHGQQVVRAESSLALVILDATCAASVNLFVEVVDFHYIGRYRSWKSTHGCGQVRKSFSCRSKATNLAIFKEFSLSPQVNLQTLSQNER